MIDLTIIVQTDTAKIVLRDPVSRDDLPASITVYGMHTEQFQTAYQQLDADVKKVSMQQRTSKLLAAITCDWDGIGESGVEIPCDPEAAERIYLKHAWIRTQVDSALLDVRRFFPNYLPQPKAG